jgi:hypothetical protein
MLIKVNEPPARRGVELQRANAGVAEHDRPAEGTP